MSKKERIGLASALCAIIGAAVQMIGVIVILGAIIDIGGVSGISGGATFLIIIALLAALVISTIVVAAMFCKKRLSLGLSIALTILLSVTLILLIIGAVYSGEIGAFDILTLITFFAGICLLIIYFCTKQSIAEKPAENSELQNNEPNQKIDG